MRRYWKPTRMQYKHNLLIRHIFKLATSKPVLNKIVYHSDLLSERNKSAAWNLRKIGLINKGLSGEFITALALD